MLRYSHISCLVIITVTKGKRTESRWKVPRKYCKPLLQTANSEGAHSIALATSYSKAWQKN